MGSIDRNFYALNASNGAKLWSFDTNARIFSSPAVTHGLVYVGCGYNMFAFNASTGSEIWNFSTANQIRSSPAIANGILYFASNDGHFYAIGELSLPVAFLSNPLLIILLIAIILSILAVAFLVKYGRENRLKTA